MFPRSKIFNILIVLFKLKLGRKLFDVPYPSSVWSIACFLEDALPVGEYIAGNKRIRGRDT